MTEIRKNALIIIKDGNPGSAKRIAIQALEQSKFVVEIEIPEIDKVGNCDCYCPFMGNDKGDDFCNMKLSLNEDRCIYPKPGPQCPRYQNQEEKK